MHEMSIALAVIEQVEAVAARTGERAALTVRLRVGELAGVVPDALAFAFEVARAETVLRDAELVVEGVPGRARCGVCAVEWAVGVPPDLCCPECAGASTELLCGRELQIVDVCWADPVQAVGYAQATQEG
ncbi:hydrogenase maturation nickel metallochaperone HypA/HybF [Embleya sp. NPDC055664]